MDPELEECMLALRARDGDREALAELVERTRTGLFAVAYAELRHYEDAQDAVAAALLRICRHVGRLREPERVRAWMQRIVRNEARRLREQRAPHSATIRLDEAPSPDEGGDTLLRLDIERALRQLPRDQARAVALFYLSGLPVREIAAETGRPEGTIRRWLHEGRHHLAAKMEGYSPMTPTTTATPRRWTAAILSTDLDSSTLEGLVQVLKDSWWDEVATVGAMPVVHWATEDGTTQFQLAELLRGKQFLLLDEWIGGRSAFEVLTLLKATEEAKGMMFCLLAASPEESTLYAAWIAGFDLCIAKPVNLGELQGRSIHVQVALSKREEDPAEWTPRLERHRKAFVFAPLRVRHTREVYLSSGHATEEAQRLGHAAADAEHLLLGLLQHGKHAARLLECLGVSCDAVRSEIERLLTPGDTTAVPQEPQVTPRWHQVMEWACDEAMQMDEKVAGTEYVLLGLIREGEGVAWQALSNFGADLAAARRAVAGPALRAMRDEVVNVYRRRDDA